MLSYKNKCDHCHKSFGDIKYDAMTIFGPWADLCGRLLQEDRYWFGSAV